MHFKFYSKNRLLFLLITIACSYGCVNNKADTIKPINHVICDTTNLSYSADINPIIQENCAISGCHTNSTMAGSFTFETYTGFHQAVQHERLIGAIHHQSGFVPMPHNRPQLSDCDIAKITQWVSVGAPNN